MTIKRVIIGLTGGIAVYKTCYLIRSFIRYGVEVKTVATENALKFIGETTLRTLSGNDVYKDTFADWNSSSTEHISLSDRGDIFIVAPATGNIIGKCANGIADDALSTALMAFDKKILFAPAMNDRMYFNPAVVRNIELLKNDGKIFIDPGKGDLACGYKAPGRMAEPEDIFREAVHYLDLSDDFKGKKFVITASKTMEFIDPVRYLSNLSSGKTGFALAASAAQRGAETVLITGPTDEKINSNVKRIDVISAEEMYNAVLNEIDDADCIIMSAAVADFTFKRSASKIKKSGNQAVFEPVRTKDILKEAGSRKKEGMIIAGFALETDNALENARSKLESKNIDMIVLNEVTEDNPAMGVDENKISLITSASTEEIPKSTKTELSKIILDKISELF